ncbi:hypothetical protein AURDEDRAFT_127468 [Auricularia subglabra TFB-10046 SS5]|nr:hypothetical protein AURDEDRAFT_127468 [Auricularia subglabra TFB-10046 SS5]
MSSTSTPLPKCSKTVPELTHLTALVFLPPPEIQARANALRSGADRSFPRFTAHITLPFVEQPDVDTAVEQLRAALAAAPLEPFDVVLDHVHQFRGRHNVTVYLAPRPASAKLLCRAGEVLQRTFRLAEDKGRPFSPHLTIGQASHSNAPIELLTRKARRLLADGPLTWTLRGFVFLRKDLGDKDMLMRPYAFVPFDGQAGSAPSPDSMFVDPRAFPTFAFSHKLERWVPTPAAVCAALASVTFCVAAYDLSQLTGAALKPRALLTGQPDLLVLHGATDAILDSLLSDTQLHAHFAWCSQGTGSVLPSELNIVVFATSPLPFKLTAVGASSLSVRLASETLSTAHLEEAPTSLQQRPAVCIVYTQTQRSLLHLEEPPGYACHMDPQFALHPRDPGYCILVESSRATVEGLKFRRGALGCAALASISMQQHLVS